MTIREKLNENPAATGGAAAAIVLVALLVLLRTSCSSGAGGGGANAGVTREFFTVDDGKTWFPADAGKIPPFDHEGKPAYRVRVYRCPHGKDFAAHLERYAEADRKKIESLAPKSAAAPSMEFNKLLMAIEVKRPGQADWVTMSPRTARQFYAILAPKCPEGKSDGLQRVLPP